MPADAGIRFGQYVLIRRIARGGMAEVFLAQQRGLEGYERRVAVKRILPHLADAPDFVKMFLGEAKLAAQLAHPNVVHIYEFGKVRDDYFIAMEFVEGVHMGQLFKQGEKEKISPTLVARIGADAATALHYAHELRGSNGKPYGLVHRDVSPANIMVSFDGIVKLCDFGIAKAAAAGDQLTNPGQVKGKYAYMSPEQTTAGHLDGRSDVFSLSIVLWEMLTGKYIVPRGDAVAAMRMIRDGKLEPIERAAPDIPATLAKAIAWGLETKRDKRATASDLAQALEAFIKSSPELATSMQLGQWIRSRFPRDTVDESAGGGTGAHDSPGTQAAPGTNASAGTMATPATPIPGSMMLRSSAGLPETPMFPARRRVVKVVQSDVTEGTEIYSTGDLEEFVTGNAPSTDDTYSSSVGASTVLDSRVQGGDEPTLGGGVGDETEVVAPRHMPPGMFDEDSASGHTIERPPAKVVPTLMMPPAPLVSRSTPSIPPPLGSQALASGPHISQSGVHVPRSGPQPPQPSRQSPALGMQMPAALGARSPHTIRGTGNEGMLSPRTPSSRDIAPQRPPMSAVLSPDQAARLRRKRLFITIGGLAGLMLLSFMIALAASNDGDTRPAAGSGTAPVDDGSGAVVVMTHTDASLPVVSPPPPLDAAVFEPTVPNATIGTVIVRTTPEGAAVNVGAQVGVVVTSARGAAAAQLVLAAGMHTVVAESPGYQDEQLEVKVVAGETKNVEITFKKLAGRATPGRLSVDTTPWSDVYSGAKKLAQAPFDDLALAPGSYTLTFKNPTRPTAVTKTVTIKAGKPTKLTFKLP